MQPFRENKNIGVIGMYQSGKTVFMTSLINHLQNHHPSRFPLGDGRIELNNFRKRSVAHGWEEFDYERYRQDLTARQVWPEKSRVLTQYRFSLTRSDRPRTKIRISLTDIPGERLADFAIVRNTYEEWSDGLIRLFTLYPEFEERARDYAALMEKTSDEHQVLETYRLTLARLILSYMPVVTPSTFLLDPAGDYVRERDVQGIAAVRWSGLSGERQFAPLSRAFRERHGDMADAFKKRYEEYRGRIVVPVVEAFRACRQIVVLVDITTILAGGLGMYHGNLDLINHLFDALDPGYGFWSSLADMPGQFFGRYAGLNVPGIRRVAIVATKADKVIAEDRQRLLTLLRSMTERRMRDIQTEKKLDVAYFICAASDSTACLSDGFLEGQLMERRDGRFLPSRETPFSRFKPSRTPDDWPDDWGIGDFVFPNVWPQIPPRRDLPPPHIELNRIAEYLLMDNASTDGKGFS